MSCSSAGAEERHTFAVQGAKAFSPLTEAQLPNVLPKEELAVVTFTVS